MTRWLSWTTVTSRDPTLNAPGALTETKFPARTNCATAPKALDALDFVVCTDGMLEQSEYRFFIQHPRGNEVTERFTAPNGVRRGTKGRP